MIFENNTPVNTQNNIQPNNIDRNFPNQMRYVSPVTIHPSRITHNITKNIARAVPSLNKLSHSNIRANFLGAPMDLNIDRTATGSVADINTQNSKHIMNGISSPTKGNIAKSQKAIIIAESIKPNIANALMDFQLFIICL